MAKTPGNRTKSPHFFCESCGAEVPRDAKSCPGCGRFFSSVLCPSCGFAGEESLFRGGCPNCGYSSGVNPWDTARGAGSEYGRGLDFPESKKPSGPLPIWLYILTAAVFTAIMAALFFTILH